MNDSPKKGKWPLTQHNPGHGISSSDGEHWRRHVPLGFVCRTCQHICLWLVLIWVWEAQSCWVAPWLMILKELETQYYFSFFMNSKTNNLGRSGQIHISVLLAFHEKTEFIRGYWEIFGSRMFISFPCAKPRSRSWYLRGVFKGILRFSVVFTEQKKMSEKTWKTLYLETSFHFILLNTQQAQIFLLSFSSFRASQRSVLFLIFLSDF